MKSVDPEPEAGASVPQEKRTFLSVISLAVLLFLAGCARFTKKPVALNAAAIDAEARRLMATESVQGMALAVIEAGRVIHVAAYGRRSVERNLPLTTETVMYGASLTKTAFTYMLLQLVDAGRLNLDASVADLLPRPLPEYDDFKDLAGDERWRALTPRILLTHTSGFANFRWLEADQRLRFHYDPGTRYGYSGEGFYILQLILEQGLGLDVGKEMQARVFDRFGMTNTSMSWRPDFSANLADGYGLDGSMEPHDERSSASAAGSMDTSIADQARLWAGIVRGDGLSPASRAEMVRPQFPITSAHQFPTLTNETEPRNAEIGLAAGLGVVTFRDATGPAWFKGGHNDWTGNMVICLENKKRCLVMLANDVRAERVYPALARIILGDIKMPWTWEYDWLEARRQNGPGLTRRRAPESQVVQRPSPTP
jgi:CubicO group peptidase (beta-lactamase class C family)